MKEGGTKSIERTDIRLGQGGQGSVYLGRDEQGNEYAIKITDLSNFSEDKRVTPLKNFIQEVVLLSKVKSRYVAKFYGQANDKSNHLYYLLLEYCHSDLQKVINQRQIFPEKEAEKIIWEIFQA